MATKTAREKSVGATKNHARKGRKSQITGDELGEQINLTLACYRFDADIKDVLRLMELQGKRKFWREFWRVVGRTFKARAAKINGLLDEIFVGYEDDPATSHVCRRLRRDALFNYDGPATFHGTVAWVTGQLRQIEAEMNKEDRQRERFLQIYDTTQPDARDGAWSVLKSCFDLGANAQEVDEIVQTTYSKIWTKISDWMDDGPASLCKRVKEKAYFQARAWKTDRLRSRAPSDLEKLETKLAALADNGKLPPRPISLGPGPDDDKDIKDGKTSKPKRKPKPRNLLGVSLEELWNPLTLLKREFTEEELTTELRRAGPFRA